MKHKKEVYKLIEKTVLTIANFKEYKEKNYSTTKIMKRDGTDINLISKYTGLNIEEIDKL